MPNPDIVPIDKNIDTLSCDVKAAMRSPVQVTMEPKITGVLQPWRQYKPLLTKAKHFHDVLSIVDIQATLSLS